MHWTYTLKSLKIFCVKRSYISQQSYARTMRDFIFLGENQNRAFGRNFYTIYHCLPRLYQISVKKIFFVILISFLRNIRITHLSIFPHSQNASFFLQKTAHLRNFNQFSLYHICISRFPIFLQCHLLERKIKFEVFWNN